MKLSLCMEKTLCEILLFRWVPTLSDDFPKRGVSRARHAEARRGVSRARHAEARRGVSAARHAEARRGGYLLFMIFIILLYLLLLSSLSLLSVYLSILKGRHPE